MCITVDNLGDSVYKRQKIWLIIVSLTINIFTSPKQKVWKKLKITKK